MLVIRRRAGEIVAIGTNVELEILEIGHSQVKLGIRAPREVLVLRKEILLTRDQNRAASQALPAGELERLRDQLKREDPDAS
jgi:carbon storage regulator